MQSILECKMHIKLWCLDKVIELVSATAFALDKVWYFKSINTIVQYSKKRRSSIVEVHRAVVRFDDWLRGSFISNQYTATVNQTDFTSQINTDCQRTLVVLCLYYGWQSKIHAKNSVGACFIVCVICV